MTRVAAIDCGTNSIRLLVADIDVDAGTLRDVDRRMEIVRLGQDVDRTGRFAPDALERTIDACCRYADVVRATGAERVRFVATSASRDVSNREEFAAGVLGALGVDRRMEIVRLGQDVDRTGRFAPDALERTIDACRRYADVVRATGAERVRFVATSASRDVSNRDEFAAGVLGALGVEPEVVTGDEEAALSFAGATRELAGGVAEPVLVVDIGGGSTEFVLGTRTVRTARSVDIGCVRMTERHLHSDPPTAPEVAAARADIDAAISLAHETVPLDQAQTLVGLAGSVTTVAAMALDLPRYQPERIHHARITADDVRLISARLLSMDHDARAALPFMHPGRVDVIGAGALVLAAILDRVPVDEVVVSEHDILDGIAWSLTSAEW